MALAVSTAKPLVNEVLLGRPAPAAEIPGWARALGGERALDTLLRRPFARVPLTLVAIFFLRGLFLYFGQYLTLSAGACFIRDLRVRLFRSIVAQSLEWFREHSTGLLLSRVMHDAGQLQRVATTVLADAVRVLAMTPFLLATAIAHDWRIALVAAVALPLLGWPTVRLGRRLRRASTATHEGMARVASRLAESVGGAQVIQGFGREAAEVRRFEDALATTLRADLRAGRARSLSPSLMELLGAIVAAGLFFVAGRGIARGTLDPGDFTVVLVCLGLLFMSLRRMNVLYADLQQASAAAERVFATIDQAPSIRDAPGARPAPRLAERIELDRVRFAYGEREVLRGIDLVVRRGETVALVGSSGSGKTTLANLIPRFLDPTAGAVRIDGVDLRACTVRSVRDQVGIVGQETVLFDDTVRDNLAYGRPDASDPEVEAAARAARADDFVRALPQGYATRLGERGAKLSAGQRQRIAIARALLKDPPILILDEATSALDAESEEAVGRALEELMRGRTTLVIAHRLATVRRADRIVVLEEGRIVEEGRHDALLAAGGRYARLHELQFRVEDP